MTQTSVEQRSTPIAPGSDAPEFALPCTPDQRVSLADFRGQPVILAFYPEDWSPVCSDQLALYQELLPEFQKFNAQLLGILNEIRALLTALQAAPSAPRALKTDPSNRPTSPRPPPRIFLPQ